MPPTTQSSNLPTQPSPSLPPPHPRPPPAHPAPLPQLPTELIVHIFRSLDRFATASALSQTCHRLRTIRLAHAPAILPHIIECFPQARELAAAQDRARARLYPPASPQRTMSPAQRISDNHALASMTCAHFEACVVRASGDGDDDDDDGLLLLLPSRSALTPAERAHFTRSHYRALTLAIESGAGRVPRALLAPLDLLEYLRVREAMTFMRTRCRSSSLDRATAPPTLEPDFLTATASALLRLLHEDLEALPGYPRDVVGAGGARPCGHFTVGDGYGGEVGGGEAQGVRLADLLVLVGERAWYLDDGE